ncbi:hypothetical protein AAG570_006650 [Ranatra chinensis]|uniref:Integrase catalytic domain-containing protein n=1 Tax=Ranatra chinensis TaxID=642074 RepID=A0ABD0Z7C9_9HEMI
MRTTVQDIIGQCSPCNICKYERHPAIAPQEITETPTKPLEIVQADIWHWEGLKVLTVVDVTTRFLFAKCLRRKTGQQIKEGLLEFCGAVATPKKIVTDPGTEFRNKKVQEIAGELGITICTTTPGHHQSQGIIERVHLTLTEHMRLLEVAKGIKGPEAIARAVVAYNRSIHTATDRTPLELMRGEEKLERVIEKVREDKMKRTEMTNERKALKRPKVIKIGEKVYIKNLTKRKKTDPPYVGPYVIKETLPRHRVILAKEHWTRGRGIIRHTNEIRIKIKKKVLL